MAKLKNPPATVSKTVQRLLAQIHAEAEAATLAALSAKDGIVTLHPLEADKAVTWYTQGGSYICTSDGNGADVSMWRDWDAPAFWVGTEVRNDGRGREWRRSLGRHVVDDFGTLVPAGGDA